MKLRFKRQIPRATLALLGVALGLCEPRAHAESDAASRALSVQLFDQAEALLAQQRTAEACPKYAESFRLDPQLGALIYLAECYEKNGQLASAWGSYREAEEMAQKRGDERAAHAHERATALEPHLDRLLIDVPQFARVPGLEVRRDGVLVAETLWGNAAAIDPGKHQIEARAGGYKPWQAVVEVSGEAKSAEVVVPKLAVDASASAGPKPATPGASQRVAAAVVGGASVVVLGVGGFFGLSAQASYSDSKDRCSDSNICTQHGSDLRSTAKSKALVSTVATGVGVAGLATAVVLWFTAPKVEGSERTALSTARRDRHWLIAPNRQAWGMEVSGAF